MRWKAVERRALRKTLISRPSARPFTDANANDVLTTIEDSLEVKLIIDTVSRSAKEDL